MSWRLWERNDAVGCHDGPHPSNPSSSSARDAHRRQHPHDVVLVRICVSGSSSTENMNAHEASHQQSSNIRPRMTGFSYLSDVHAHIALTARPRIHHAPTSSDSSGHHYDCPRATDNSQLPMWPREFINTVHRRRRTFWCRGNLQNSNATCAPPIMVSDTKSCLDSVNDHNPQSIRRLCFVTTQWLSRPRSQPGALCRPLSKLSLRPRRTRLPLLLLLPLVSMLLSWSRAPTPNNIHDARSMTNRYGCWAWGTTTTTTTRRTMSISTATTSTPSSGDKLPRKRTTMTHATIYHGPRLSLCRFHHTACSDSFTSCNDPGDEEDTLTDETRPWPHADSMPYSRTRSRSSTRFYSMPRVHLSRGGNVNHLVFVPWTRLLALRPWRWGTSLPLLPSSSSTSFFSLVATSSMGHDSVSSWTMSSSSADTLIRPTRSLPSFYQPQLPSQTHQELDAHSEQRSMSLFIHDSPSSSNMNDKNGHSPRKNLGYDACTQLQLQELASPPDPPPQQQHQPASPLSPVHERRIRYHSYTNPFNASDTYHALDTSLSRFRAFLVGIGAVPRHVAQYPAIVPVLTREFVIIPLSASSCYSSHNNDVQDHHARAGPAPLQNDPSITMELADGAIVLLTGTSTDREWREVWRRRWFERRLLTDRTELLTRYPSDECDDYDDDNNEGDASDTRTKAGKSIISLSSTIKHKRGGFKDLLVVHRERFVTFLRDEKQEDQNQQNVMVRMTTTGRSAGSCSDQSTKPPYSSAIRVLSLWSWLREHYGVEATDALRAECMLTESAHTLREDNPLKRLKRFLEWFRANYPYYHDRCQSCGASLREDKANQPAPLTGSTESLNAPTDVLRDEFSQMDDDENENEDADPDGEDGRTFLGYVYPDVEELAGKASRTELYQCHSCAEFYRFPRYNAVSYVLNSHRGRCGEYSMLLFRIMRTLGYETRWVVDWADHVWVEVAIPTSALPDCERSVNDINDPIPPFRWIHIDPCEAAVNENLLYESWGKKPTYIVSFFAPRTNSSLSSYLKGTMRNWDTAATASAGQPRMNSFGSKSLTAIKFPLVADVTREYTSHSLEEIRDRRAESEREIASAIDEAQHELRTLLQDI